MTRYASLPKARTDKGRLTDALMFIGMARDHVFLATSADDIATMKGVTGKAARETIAQAYDKRREGMAA